MRTDQHVGLPPAARLFLVAHEQKAVDCPHCHRPMPHELPVIGKYEGMDEYPLFRHPLNDGGHADEFLQASPWSSGPLLFLGLLLYKPNGDFEGSIEWTEDGIQEQL